MSETFYVSRFAFHEGVEMKAHDLGHLVFYVKDLARSMTFSRDLLGFQEVGRIFAGAAAALTPARTHHELLLIQMGTRRGLQVEGGLAIDGMSDHIVSESLYLRDPDGTEVDLYVDADESVWNNTAAAVLAGIKPLHVSATKEDCPWRNHALQPAAGSDFVGPGNLLLVSVWTIEGPTVL